MIRRPTPLLCGSLYILDRAAWPGSAGTPNLEDSTVGNIQHMRETVQAAQYRWRTYCQQAAHRLAKDGQADAAGRMLDRAADRQCAYDLWARTEGK